MDRRNPAISKACFLVGSQAKIARALGITAPTVNQWISRARPIPPERVLPIVRATHGRITPYELRPDLYPDPDWMPPGLNRAT
ncbi:transcriptional repressor of cell division inhibition gene dicB [Gammaproteobacteria bacterium]